MEKDSISYNIRDILDSIYNYVSIADKNGYIVFVNKAIEEIYGLPRETVLNKHVSELLAEGYMKESVIMKCMKSKRPEGMVHHEGRIHDNDISVHLDWASPHYDKNGELEFVVCTEWDLAHLNKMQDHFDFLQGLSPEETLELDYYRNRNKGEYDIVYKSRTMAEVVSVAKMAAGSDASILIHGESGTGKEVLMKYIHEKSSRSKAPLIEINCGAIPENLIESELFGYERGAFSGAEKEGKMGLIELANKGTFFLDEIGELSLSAQVKLLRFLQEKEIMRIGGKKLIPVDTRIIAATNIDLQRAVKEKRFREDLFYRLNVMPIVIPPLRERKEDIKELSIYFIERYSTKYKKKLVFTNEAFDIMQEYNWPGNVRELQNLIERLFITSNETRINKSTILLNLPGIMDILKNDKEFTFKSIDLKKEVEKYEKSIIERYISQYKNVRQFSRFFNIEKTTISKKLIKYDIKPDKKNQLASFEDNKNPDKI